MAEYSAYGFRTDGLDRVHQRFKCIFCQLIIKDPIQSQECGHRSCRECFEVRASRADDQRVKCPVDDCDAFTHREQIMIDKAFRRELDALIVPCMFRSDRDCPWTGPLREYEAHLNAAHSSFDCPHCQDHFTSSTALEEHVNRRCPAIFQACPLAPLCGEEMIRKEDYLQHLLSGVHQEGLIKVITGKYVFDDANQQREDSEAEAERLELEEKLRSELNRLIGETQTANDRTSDLSQLFVKTSDQIQVLVQEVNNLRTRANENLVQMHFVQKNQEKLQKEIEQVHAAIDEYQYVSTDGVLTWKIDRFADRMADARSEREPSIYSPIFYSSPTGYKMRARVFLFGDGNARRTHMSIFFFLMKGEYDSILKWPFSHRITFCLIDQSGNNTHVVDSFQPDVKSNSFKRPTSENNLASGIPKFYPLTTLQQDNNPYVREDTLYLKVIVELNETQRPMLPVMLQLNPAFPSHVQENLAQQELIRRQQQPMITDAGPVPIPTNFNC